MGLCIEIHQEKRKTKWTNMGHDVEIGYHLLD